MLYEITDHKPSDFLINPFEIPVTQAQIQVVNSYLAASENRTINAILKFKLNPKEQKLLKDRFL